MVRRFLSLAKLRSKPKSTLQHARAILASEQQEDSRYRSPSRMIPAICRAYLVQPPSLHLSLSPPERKREAVRDRHLWYFPFLRKHRVIPDLQCRPRYTR
jgi:hypothetical protein